MKLTRWIERTFLLFGLVMSGLLASANSLASEKPNIVFILSDDQAWTDYGFMGHETIATPQLDKLAQEGVVFDRGYVPTPLCRPSLMTLATGHYAHQHGVTGNDPSPKYAEPGSELYNERRTKLIATIDRFDTLPELLAEQGYISHQSGKWWEGNFRRGGFSKGMTRGFPQEDGRHGDDGLKIGREGIGEVKDFIDKATEQEKPFFIWYAPFLPHEPHTPPKRLLEKYNKAGLSQRLAQYYATVEWFDETSGELIEYLNRKQIRKNTLIVYLTDNGWIQNLKDAGYAPRSKQTPYEGGVRTPIIFSWPNRFTPIRRSELISSIDIMPTVLAAAGASIPEDLPGLNLMSNITEQTPIARKAIFGEGFAHDIADIDNPEASLLYRWSIEGRWKLILTYDGEAHRYQSTHDYIGLGPQLFDLKEDPFEQHNLAKNHPDIVKKMASRIADWYPLKKRRAIVEVSE